MQRQKTNSAVHRPPTEDANGAVAMAPHPLRQRMRSDEEYLLQQLFGSYNQFARPVLNSSCTVTVAIQFSLMHIKDLVRLSVCFSLPVSVYVSVHVCLFFPVYVCLSGCLSLSIYGWLSVFPSLDMPVRLSDCLCLYLSVCLWVSVYICLLVYVYMCLSVCLLCL